MTLPTASEEWIDPIFDAIVSDVQACGYYDKVNQHEPKKNPGNGLTAGVWFVRFRPLALNSGLAVSGALLVFNIRSYTNMLQEPADAIDPNMVKAVSNLIRRYHDDFDFGLDPVVRNVDVFGEAGVPLEAQSGYLEIGGPMHRIIDLTLPLIVNDVWPQNK